MSVVGEENGSRALEERVITVDWVGMRMFWKVVHSGQLWLDEEEVA